VRRFSGEPRARDIVWVQTDAVPVDILYQPLSTPMIQVQPMAFFLFFFILGTIGA
jgi:hypothetical protein